MAEVRKSAKQVAARQRARERATEYRAQQDRLEELAVEYFVADEEKSEIAANVEREITLVREQAQERYAEVEASSARAVASMLELGVSRAEVATRLGVALRDIKRLAAAAV